MKHVIINHTKLPKNYTHWLEIWHFFFREYHILVEEPNTDASVHNPDFNHKTYVAGKVPVKEVRSGDVEFTVGDGTEDSSNPPLVKGVKYIIYIGTCSAISETVSE